MPRWPLFLTFLFLSLLIGSCTQAPDIPRLSIANRRPIEKILIDEKLGPEDLRKILRALNEDGSINSLVKFFDDLPDESVDGVTYALNRWLYDDGRMQRWLARRFDEKRFEVLADWLHKESRFAGASDRRDLLYSFLSDHRAPSFISRLSGFLDPRIVDGWRAAEKRVEGQFVALPVFKDKVLPARVAAEDLHGLLTARDLKDATRETVSLFLEKDAGDDIYRGLRVFAEETKGAAGFESVRQGLQRMMEKPPEKFQETAERDNQLDLLLYLAETTASDSRGFFTALEHGLRTHVDLINAKKASLQSFVVDVYAERLRTELSREQFTSVYWKELLTVKSEGEAIRDLYKWVAQAWAPVVGTADNSASAGYRLAVHLNAYVVARWLYFTLKNNQVQLEKVSTETSFATQFWEMKLSSKLLTVSFAKVVEGETHFPERDLMTEDLKPIHDLMESFVRNKIEPIGRFSYQFVPSDPETTLFDALFEVVRAADRRREIVGVDTIARLAVQYLTNPELGGGFVISSFETERLVDLLNRVVSVTSLDRFRTINRLLFGDIAAEKTKPGLINPELTKVILEIFSDSPMQQDLTQKILWSGQSLAEFDYHKTKDSVTPFQAYREVVKASHFEENRPHWIGQTLAYLSKIRAVGVVKKDDGSKAPLHPLFFDGLQSRSVYKKLLTFSQLAPLEWVRVRAAFSEFSDRSIADDNLKLVSDAISMHKEGFVSFAEWWDRSPLPEGWDKLAPLEWEWFRDAISNNDHSALIRFFKGANRQEWGRIARDLKTLRQNGSLTRILKLLTLIQDDRLRDFSRVLLKADSSGELGSLLDLLSVAAAP